MTLSKIILCAVIYKIQLISLGQFRTYFIGQYIIPFAAKYNFLVDFNITVLATWFYDYLKIPFSLLSVCVFIYI